LVALTATLLITRFATVALMVTGLSRDAARFQARSALTGVGFTTLESEKVTNHPVRRRIIMILMLVGNVGFITVLATLIGSIVTTTGVTHWMKNLGILSLGLLALWMVSISPWVDRRLSRLIFWALKQFTQLDVRDYVALLHVSTGYEVTEIRVNPGDWLAGQSLAESRVSKEGVLVLGIQRQDGSYVGAPTGITEIRPHDLLIVYGATQRVQELDRRRAGPEGHHAHDAAVTQQQRLVKEQAAQEAQAETAAAMPGEEQEAES
jgi:hypothetical protein